MTVTEQKFGLSHRKGNVSQKFPQEQTEEDKAMLNSKLQLTKKERLGLEMLMLSPIPIVLAILYTTHDYLVTLIVFHVALIVGPLIFLKKKNIHINWKNLLKQDLSKNSRKMNNDVFLVAAPTVLLTIAYVLFRTAFPDYDYGRLRFPSIHDRTVAILLAIEFIIINPIVEELFWRFFCDLLIGQGKTFAQKADVCFHFGLYHWFVIFFITQDPILAAAGMLAIMNLGYILTIVKQRSGLITAMIIHVGIDLAAGIVAVDMQSKYLPFY
jgi:membrane protease YdiL (CAAX protease family)